MSQLDLYVPQFPRVPQHVDDVLDWASALNKELVRYTNDVQNKLVDRRLLLQATRQTVAEGFTVQPTSVVVELVTLSVVSISSDLRIAIALGAVGQQLILFNLSTIVMTIKNNAQTSFAAGVDFDLRPGAHVFMRWTGNSWYIVAGS